MRCVKCEGREFATTKGTRTVVVPVKVRGEAETLSFRATVPVRKCKRCGTEHELGPISERLDLTVAMKAIELGVGSGGVLRFARKALGMRAVDLGELLDVTAETISHWENDKKGSVDRGVWVVLRDLVDDALHGKERTRDQLKAMSTAKLPKRPIELEVSADSI